MRIPRASRRTRIVWFRILGSLDIQQVKVLRGWRGLNESNQVCPHCGKANQIYRYGSMFGADKCHACGSLISWWPEREKPKPEPRWYGQPGPVARVAAEFEYKLLKVYP